MIFVDTGAWFASVVPSDARHARARAWLAENVDRLVTSDYIIDELLTLLKIRGHFQRARIIGDELFQGDLADVEWVTEEDVQNAWKTFCDFADKGWSFTDCVSKVMMNRLAISTAFSFDQHFLQFGSVAVVPSVH